MAFTTGNDTYYVKRYADSGTFDGLAGTDTVNFDRLSRSQFNITQDSNGRIHVDSVSGASHSYHFTLSNFERLAFSNGSTVVNLTTLFGPPNHAPVVANAIADQQAETSAAFSLTVASNTFTDSDGDAMTYSATLAGGTALPSWLHFDAATRTFSGTPTNAAVGTISVVVKATDSKGASVSDTFVLTVVSGNDTLAGTSGVDTLKGLAGDDTLTGGAGNDILIGGAGNDTLDGETGNDIYIVESGSHHAQAEVQDSGGDTGDEIRFSSTTANDTLVLAAGDTGIERVVIGIGTATVAVGTGTTALNVDATNAANGLAIYGNAGVNTLTGGAFDDTIAGNAGNDTLNGGLGNDTLNGGAGADTMTGGTGDDTYVVDSALDIVTELNGEGTDTVQSTISYSLVDTDGAGTDGGNVENLTLTGIAAINGTGNALANTLTGNAAANILDGGDGNDTLSGLAGNDKLQGGIGDDRLVGGIGNDTLVGGDGVDTFVFDAALVSTNRDTVQDFLTAEDIFQLEDSIFTALNVGTLDAAAFQTGTTSVAQTVDTHIIFNSTTGGLYYDVDGTGAAAAVQFATVSTITGTLAATNFEII